MSAAKVIILSHRNVWMILRAELRRIWEDVNNCRQEMLTNIF
jgi:hypothetical protein